MSAYAILMLFLCILFYACQSIANKFFSIGYKGAPALATTVFAFLSGVICAAANWVFGGFTFSASPLTWGFGLFNGVTLFLFRYAVVNASRTGPYSFQSLMSTFGNILFPMFFSVIFWGDRLSLLSVVGIALMLVSSVLFNLKGLNLGGAGKAYYLWVGLQSLTNGLYGILLDSQQRAMLTAERNEMIIITFLVSSIISLIALLFTEKRRAIQAFRMGAKPWFFAIFSSAAGVIAVNLLMICLGLIPTSVFYAMENGGVLAVSVLLGAKLFHEKLDLYKIAGLVSAVISLALLSL